MNNWTDDEQKLAAQITNLDDARRIIIELRRLVKQLRDAPIFELLEEAQRNDTTPSA